jgi:tRNA/tmRNA/rRNA uracil-C5-methylase (TrmA/RlmC/RlmD family)
MVILEFIKKCGCMLEKMGNLSFRITAKSFYQTNPAQAEVLYAEAIELAALKETWV